MKKETFLSILLWGIVAYSVAVLSYFTLKVMFKHDSSFISAFGAILSASGTFFAAFIATKLYNNWRDEKRYDLESKYLASIIQNLSPIFLQLMNIKNDAHNLGNIENSAILKTTYLLHNQFNMYDSIISLYPDIRLYCDITKDDSLIDFYNKFDKKCYILEDFYVELFSKKYQKYYYKYLNEVYPSAGRDFKIDANNAYMQNLSDETKKNIEDILNFLTQSDLVAKTNNVEEKVSFYEWLEQTIELYNEIHKYCAKNIQPKDY